MATSRITPAVAVSARGLENLLVSRGYKLTGLTRSLSDYGGQMFDLDICPGRSLPRVRYVRVVIYPDDGPRVDIHSFDRHGVCAWSVHFSPGTPEAVVLAAIDAAEVAR
jgi:hypothetical protein